MFKVITLSVLGFVALLAVGFGLDYLGYAEYGFFAPRYRAVDSKVFHESEQYNEGMQNDFDSLMLQYKTADTDGKAALKPIILHRFAKYDVSKFNPDQRDFYYQLKGE